LATNDGSQDLKKKGTPRGRVLSSAALLGPGAKELFSKEGGGGDVERRKALAPDHGDLLWTPSTFLEHKRVTLSWEVASQGGVAIQRKEGVPGGKSAGGSPRREKGIAASPALLPGKRLLTNGAGSR